MLLRYFLLLFPTLFCITAALAQGDVKDSVRSLSEITVSAIAQNPQTVGGTRSVVRNVPIQMQNKSSLVQIINTVPGIRMEERSPGSYRVSIRGSSLRSPFGVRNIKVYWNDIPFTDPGGNTYFNQFAATNISSMTIYKGPASSVYGQGTGGVITIQNRVSENATGIEYSAGSYNYHSFMAKAGFGNDSAGRNLITYARNQGDGYRDQTKMRRDNLSWVSELAINKNHRLNVSILYTDMYYQTPGGLTLTEFQQNPRASRPAVGSFPSAKDANAAIWQKNFTAGVTHNYPISNSFSQKTTVYGAFAQVKNAAVRNFERRNEPHFGGRTMLSYDKKFGTDLNNRFNWDNGVELQQGYFNTLVSGNKNGAPDTVQTNDDINSTVYNIISQATLSLKDRWVFVAGVSVNKSRLKFTRLNEYPVNQQTFNFNNEFAPRLGLLHRFTSGWTLVGNISKGFSPPTVAELLPSTGIITPLSAEKGWNYEAIVRKNIYPIRTNVDVSGYIFKLENALVQRRDAAGADYFINAGSIDQKGIEAMLRQNLPAGNSTLFEHFENDLSYTFSYFRYHSFTRGSDDFSGKIVPGVPRHTIAYKFAIFLNNGLQLNANYYTASKIFLNDANTATADPYHLLGFRLGWRKMLNGNIAATVYTGVDNALNQIYSLGNDINAAGGRYYNVAPGRNYYAGIAFELNKSNAGTN
ncbi:MAG: hypothetical protein BGN92_07745 [Sphingobacteriales bacterium 41-5]|nr:MAG: hypothetical protein BGN92_07745 [Sphingobacteriales bacterium 41-5]